MTVAGSRICDLGAGELKEGGPADICIFDPKAEWLVQESEFGSRSKNSPFIGETLKGLVKYTICDGKTVYQRG
jgi:dihydroorotase